MADVRVMKRGKVYQYQFEIASVNGTRKYINKSGFKTKAEALEAGIDVKDITFIKGTVYKTKDLDCVYDEIRLPSYGSCQYV